MNDLLAREGISGICCGRQLICSLRFLGSVLFSVKSDWKLGVAAASHTWQEGARKRQDFSEHVFSRRQRG